LLAIVNEDAKQSQTFLLGFGESQGLGGGGLMISHSIDCALPSNFWQPECTLSSTYGVLIKVRKGALREYGKNLFSSRK
jgi:hypothetical protein